MLVYIMLQDSRKILLKLLDSVYVRYSKYEYSIIFYTMKLTEVIINDGLNDIEYNNNPYGVARNLIKIIIQYRTYESILDEIESGFIDLNRKCPLSIIMQYGAKGNQRHLIEYVLSKKNSSNMVLSGMLGTIEGGHQHLVDYFIDKGIDNWYVCVTRAIQYRQLNFVKLFVSKFNMDWNTFFVWLDPNNDKDKEFIKFFMDKINTPVHT